MRLQAVFIWALGSVGFSCATANNAPSEAQINATITSVYQLGYYDDARDDNGEIINDKGRGSFALDVEGEFEISKQDNLYALASFAQGNGLKNEGGISLAINADDLEDDVENINGRNRDYLLEVWYRRELIANDTIAVAVTGGLIDATRYLDHNRVANDEITQFMNEAFVTRFFLPSYDAGIAVQTQGDNWHIDMAWLHTQTDSNENGGVDYDFYGVDLGYVVDLPFGEGHIHLVGQTTSSDFVNCRNANKQASIDGLSISLDQSLGDEFAIFLRAGSANNDASELVHDALYSAGFEFSGQSFSAPKLTMGVAYAYLDGAGNQLGDIRHTRVLETYARYPIADFGEVSADAQWVSDEVRSAQNTHLSVISTRLTLYF